MSSGTKRVRDEEDSSHTQGTSQLSSSYSKTIRGSFSFKDGSSLSNEKKKKKKKKTESAGGEEAPQTEEVKNYADAANLVGARAAAQAEIEAEKRKGWNIVGSSKTLNLAKDYIKHGKDHASQATQKLDVREKKKADRYCK
jgi:hypothetical protein